MFKRKIPTAGKKLVQPELSNTLAVGMQNGTAYLENSWAVSPHTNQQSHS